LYLKSCGCHLGIWQWEMQFYWSRACKTMSQVKLHLPLSNPQLVHVTLQRTILLSVTSKTCSGSVFINEHPFYKIWKGKTVNFTSFLRRKQWLWMTKYYTEMSINNILNDACILINWKWWKFDLNIFFLFLSRICED
jgi:hypothetical protein